MTPIRADSVASRDRRTMFLGLLQRPRAGLFSVGYCIIGLWLGGGAGPAMSQPLPLTEEPTPEQRQKLEKGALALNQQAVQRYQQGRWDEAVKLMEQALHAYRRLYPAERYRDGHPDLAVCLNNLGRLLQTRGELAQAEPYIRQALAMCQKLYPKERFPAGHPNLALCLNNLGTLLNDRGELAQAEPYFRQALAMRLKLYPKERYPDGHPDLAIGLNNLGSLLHARGELAQAEPYYRQALVMKQKLYPKERFPHGHPDLANSLSNLGVLLKDRGDLALAEPYCRQALAMRHTLYPKERYPNGHPDLADSLNNLGMLLKDRGDLALAEPYCRQALAIRLKVYPKERFPNGHPDLAIGLNNLGSLLSARGELALAEPYYRQALAMRQKLYPQERYPNGHPDLALVLNNLGVLLRDRGDLALAEPYHRQALAMRLKLYPKERYPNGHPNLAVTLNGLGGLLHARAQSAQAEAYYRQALAMRQTLYPKERYPNGHPEIAASLNNVGLLLRDRGELAQAEPFLRQALAMLQKLYPNGHPNVAVSLNNLGGLLYARGELAQAEPYLRQALTINQRLGSALLAGSAETEGLNYLAKLPLTRDGYLSVTRDLVDKSPPAYRVLWQLKGGVAGMLQQRRLALAQTQDQATHALAQKLASTRRTLASLLRPGTNLRPEQAERVRELSKEKDNLEKQLADQLPLYRALQERFKREPAELLPLLPADAAFVDLTRYWHIKHDPKVPGLKGERWRLSYVAFVLARGQPIRRVELGQAEPIDQAVTGWRRSLQGGQATSPAAATLRRLLWRPLEEALPSGTRTVILAPDAALTGLPWAALPGSKTGRLLVEEYALATVPDGQGLLDLLLTPPAKSKQQVVLAAGGIDYDAPATDVAPAPPAESLSRAPRTGTDRPLWSALPATADELAQVERLAGKRTVVKHQGAAASTGRLLEDLPRARWAHLATHGFFADPSVRSIFQLSALDYQRGRRGERIGLVARSPLVLSGLVCAGANRQVKDREKGDGGILTAEAIAGLNLDGLELAVLSACETGLGEVAGGEGVFGLQRAFHLAGTRTVVASLWKLDDAATQVLMQEFYRNLWERKLPSLEALRRAQLAMLLHYDAKAGRLRAPGAAVPVDPAELAAAREKLRSAGRPPLPPLYWAGFVLSGDWR
jgi:CHAT domain-containing protein/Tfp pilus assembly protein PilF